MCKLTGSPGEEFIKWGVRDRFTVQQHQTQAQGATPRSASLLTLVDSGARVSMIRRSAAEELGLQPVGERNVHHFGGPATLKLYVASIGCACGETRGIQLVDDGGANHPVEIDFPELLLGRNVLQYASLAIDPAGSWELEIDFLRWEPQVIAQAT